jgi:4-hydroxy-tetrahydrodipicolinate synthase
MSATPSPAVWRNCAILTPLTEAGDVDHGRLAAHARGLLDAGLNGVTLFGTTGEGPAFTVGQRLRTVEALLRAGLPADTLTLGVASAALGDAVELTAAAGRLGLRAVLASPPFYFKDATEAGLFTAFAALVERSGAAAAPIMLYHIPSFTGLPLRPALLRRLADTFPGRVFGLKDSGIDLPKTLELLSTCRDLTILVGAEEHIPDVMAAGGRGTICGLANLDPALVNRLLDGDRSAIPAIRALAAQLQGRQFVAAMKQILADRLGDPAWRRVAPPLLPIEDAASTPRAA